MQTKNPVPTGCRAAAARAPSGVPALATALALALAIALAPAPVAGHGIQLLTPPQGERIGYLAHFDGGTSRTVAVRGGTAFLGEGPRLTVLDLSDPTWPVPMGKTGPLPGEVMDVDVEGDHAYVAYGGARDGLAIVDVSEPREPRFVGRYALPEADRVTSVDVQGGLAYLTVSDRPGGQLWVVDVRDPANPAVVGVHQAAGELSRVVLSGDLAFLLGKPALTVLDLDRPGEPRPVGSYTGLFRGQNVHVAGQRAYLVGQTSSVSGQGALRVLDLSDPGAPVAIGGIDFETCGCSGVAGAGERLLIGDSLRGQLRVVDVGDPARPLELGQAPVFGGGGEVAATGDHALVATGGHGGLAVVDIGRPRSPQQVATYDLPGLTRVVVVEDGLVFAGHDEGLTITDVREPGRPRRLAFWPTPSGVTNLAVVGTRAYLGLAVDGLDILDVGDPRAPRRLGQARLPGPIMALAVAGQRVHVGVYADFDRDPGSRLLVLDASDPAQLVPLGAVDFPWRGMTAIAVRDETAFVVGSGQLTTIDLAEPSAPAVVGAIAAVASDMEVSGSLAYLYGDGALRILDISDPARPVPLAAADFTDYGQEMSLSGGRAFLSGPGGLTVVDVSDPARPRGLGRFETAVRVVSVDAEGATAYAADIHGGVYVVNLFRPISQLWLPRLGR